MRHLVLSLILDGVAPFDRLLLILLDHLEDVLYLGLRDLELILPCFALLRLVKLFTGKQLASWTGSHGLFFSPLISLCSLHAIIGVFEQCFASTELRRLASFALSFLTITFGV